MKKLIIVANDLESSGKSVLARAISSHLKNNEVSHQLITSNEMDVTDTFEGEFWDLEDQFDSSLLIAAMDSHDALVLDIHTGAARNWGEFCEEEEIENLLVELDAEMTIVIPSTGNEQCNNEIVDLGEIFSDSADYVIAHVPMEVEERTALEWTKSPADKAMRNLGAVNLDISDLSDDLVTAIGSSNKNFVSALNQPSTLPRFTEVQITQWLENVGNSLEEAGDYLLPEVMGAVVLDY